MDKKRIFVYIVVAEIIVEIIILGIMYGVKKLKNNQIRSTSSITSSLVMSKNNKKKVISNDNHSEKNKENKENVENKVNNFSDNEEEKKDYIKWVDFKVTDKALSKAYQYDVESVEDNIHIKWIEVLAYLGCKYGGDFKKFNEKDMENIVFRLKNGEKIGEITKDMKYYSYYYEAYEAVLGGMVGHYKIKVEDSYVKRYGLVAFFPIAKNYYFSHYDDFGNARDYGFKRKHLGHDLMGSVGTPIIACESGVVEALGWNRYGGWRIGIRSFDQKRYYYYAHLRKNFPYNKSLKIGSKVVAGDVIGYMGRTGYSNNENVNNIDKSHLHFGIQLIFHPSQKEGNNEIWIDCYEITKFLYKNRSETIKNTETKEYYPLQSIILE